MRYFGKASEAPEATSTDALARSDQRSIQLLMLPGLGGDHRMASHHQRLPFSVIAPDYIPWAKGESLADYSRRFYRSLVERKLIDHLRPLYVAGSSLGGAVAQEICNISDARGVIVVGSLRKGTELRTHIGFVGRYLASVLPYWVYSIAGIFLPFVMHSVSQISEADVALSKAMYRSLPRGLFRSGFSAIAQWQGCAINIPMLRIHGRHDHIIPFTNDMAADIVIERGKHLIAMSDANAVNRAIELFIDRVESCNKLPEKT